MRPLATLNGHNGWILYIAQSTSEEEIATAAADAT